MAKPSSTRQTLTKGRYLCQHWPNTCSIGWNIVSYSTIKSPMITARVVHSPALLSAYEHAQDKRRLSYLSFTDTVQPTPASSNCTASEQRILLSHFRIRCLLVTMNQRNRGSHKLLMNGDTSQAALTTPGAVPGGSSSSFPVAGRRRAFRA